MFRSSSTDAPLDPRLKQILEAISRDVFGPDEDVNNLDFATIEQRAHEVGRRVARQLTEEAAAKQAQTCDKPQACPDCQRACAGSIENRELLTQDGSIQLQEAGHFCSHCRRAFFPQQTQATIERRFPRPVNQSILGRLS
jgi:hypothetical protein